MISSLCFVLGRGGSNGQVRMAMRASSTLLGICGCDMSLSMSTPLMSVVSARDPPTLPSTLMRSNRTSLRSRSATCNTASTAICANCLCSLDTLCDRHQCRRGKQKVPGKHFATETGHGSFEQVFCVGLAVLNRVCYAVEVVHCDRARPIEAVCNPDGVNATFEKRLALL